MSASSHNVRTKPYTDLVFEDQIKSSIRSAKIEISEILKSLKDRTAVFTYKGQIVTAEPVDFPRLLAEWSTKTKVQQSVKNIITSAMFSAEEKCSGAALIGAGHWVSNAEIKSSISKKRCDYLQMKECLGYLGNSGLSFATSIALVESGGLGCKIDYEENRQPETKVISRSGRVIFGEVDHLFGDRVGRQFDLNNCCVIAILGTVESVSSLHFILESSIERPVLILAENFLPDVANTLAETWRQNRGKCIPFVVKNWSVENFLDLEKQGILCISNERGDTFSKLKLESQSDLSISTNATTCTVSGGKEQTVSKLTVEISQSLGGMTGLVKDRVKMLVGFARQCARGGVTRWENLSGVSHSFLDLYSKDLVISSQSVVAGVKTSESLKKVLQELGCMILVSQGVNS